MSIPSCSAEEKTLEKACEEMKCPSGLSEKRMLSNIGIILCGINTTLAQSEGSEASFQVDAKDAGPAWETLFGINDARVVSANASVAPISVTAAPGAGLKLVITDVLVSSDTAMRLDFNVEDTPATKIETLYIGANQTQQVTFRGKWKLATAAKALQVQSSVAGNISVTVLYYFEA